jgi:D-sedoheptulose 7-phosphate isomerase
MRRLDIDSRVLKSPSLISMTQRQGLDLTSCRYVRGVVDVLERLPFPLIDEVVAKLFQAYEQDCALYLFGNGGSAALASHAACDLGKGTSSPGKRPFRVMSLNDNVPLITAWANDTCYENIFAAQLKPFVRAGDLVLAISGSGNSGNVLSGLLAARELGAFNIGLTGFAGGKMETLCDSCIVVPSENMQQIEDSHVCIMHAIYLGFQQCVKWSCEGRS